MQELDDTVNTEEQIFHDIVTGIAATKSSLVDVHASYTYMPDVYRWIAEHCSRVPQRTAPPWAVFFVLKAFEYAGLCTDVGDGRFLWLVEGIPLVVVEEEARQTTEA